METIQHTLPLERVMFSELDYDDDYRFIYRGELFTGTAYTYDPENEDEIVITSETPFANGHKTGPCREWHPSGQLATEYNMKDGTAHGPDREWYENGQLKLDKLSEWGTRLYVKEWDEQGNLTKDYKLKSTDRDYQSLLLSRRIWGHEIDWEPEE